MSAYSKWPLCADVFTFWDKIKISWFLFSERIWTYGTWVRAYEVVWEKTFGCKHAIMVSSGSTANELIALRRKWELQQTGEWPRRNKIIFPVNTWISSVSPWIHVGFEPVFVDVETSNLNVSASILKAALNKNTDGSIASVFYTALLGYFNDLEECKALTEAHGARFMMDNCEASFSMYWSKRGEYSPILNLATCSTSIFYSHFTTSGSEGGLIFTESDDEADWYRMMRSHGLTRNMPAKYRNPNVGAEFDFYLLGSNYRSSNLQAYMASLDFKRAYRFSSEYRNALVYDFYQDLSPTKYARFGTLHAKDDAGVIPLAIPILCKTPETRTKVEQYLKRRGVMTRPIIGGCLLAHTAFKGYGDINDYPVAKWSHECGLYIGLNQNVTFDMVEELAKELNAI